MLLGENSRTVALDIEDKIKEIRKSIPDWVKLETLYNRSELVNSTLGTVEKSTFRCLSSGPNSFSYHW